MNTVDIPRVTITGQLSGPHLLITAGVHGDEFEPMTAVRELVRRFKEASSLRGRVTLVPVVNQPAFERGQRTADDGLDLARTCPGRENGSITERVAAELSRLIRQADYYIDLHTGGRLYRVAPLAGYALHADGQILEKQRAMARAFNLPIVWGTQGRLEGRSLSVARDAGVPAIYTEYEGGGGDPAAVEAYVAGCLNVAAQLSLVDRSLAESRVRYVVEDDRDQAGHLQVQHPAPADGFFQPAVRLGQVVRRGEPLGEIVDAIGQRSTPVPAGDDGVVLFLRVVPPVHAGDALGGVLPILEPGEIRYGR